MLGCRRKRKNCVSVSAADSNPSKLSSHRDRNHGSFHAGDSKPIQNQKQTQPNSSNWSDLPADLLAQILHRLNFIDVARARSVCSHWSRSVSPSPAGNNPTPWLLIPDRQGLSLLYNPADGRRHWTKTLSVEFEFKSSFLIGSSHGCLIGLPGHGSPAPFVLNPLTGSRIGLPCIENLVDLNLAGSRTALTWDWIRRSVRKGILTAQVGSWCAAVLLYACRPHFYRLAACSLLHGDDGNSWTELDGGSQWIQDVCSIDGKIFALGKSCSVLMWDSNFSNPPFQKLMVFEPTAPLPPSRWGCRGHIPARLYIEMPLLVRKSVRYIVSDKGWKVGFEVFRMDDEKGNWVEVESLGENRALFLGRSHCVSVPATGGIEADCIYFTRDDRADKDDARVYRLRDGTIRELDQNIYRPWSWIVPTP